MCLVWDIETFEVFLSYTGGQRGNVSLPNILKFVTGAEEEPVLGFSYHPFIMFVEAEKSFLPMANTVYMHQLSKAGETDTKYASSIRGCVIPVF